MNGFLGIVLNDMQDFNGFTLSTYERTDILCVLALENLTTTSRTINQEIGMFAVRLVSACGVTTFAAARAVFMVIIASTSFKNISYKDTMT